MSKHKRKTNRGWEPGRARVEGGPVIRSRTVGLTADAEAALKALIERWSVPEGEAIRRALRLAAGHSEPVAEA